MRVLKNTAIVPVHTTVEHREIDIKPKGSLTIIDSLEDKIANYLLETFRFLKDITPTVSYAAPQNDAELKRVVKKAEKKPVKSRRRQTI